MTPEKAETLGPDALIRMHYEALMCGINTENSQSGIGREDHRILTAEILDRLRTLEAVGQALVKKPRRS